MTGLASEVTKGLFEFLAQEEMGHKNKIEVLYDDIIYKEF
jgi:rubrerythrin